MKLSSIPHRMMRLMMPLLPSCKEITGLLSNAMDGNPSLFTRWKMRLHLALCRLCRRYKHHLHLIRRGASFCAEPEQNRLDVNLPVASKARLKRILAEKTKFS